MEELRSGVIKSLQHHMANSKFVERPFVTVSFAQSLDGCLSENENTSTQISDKQSAILTHQIRAIHDGILIGVNTLEVDNPQLTVRLAQGNSPRPIIIDPQLRSKDNLRLFSQEKTPLIYCGKTIEASFIAERQTRLRAEIVPLMEGSHSISLILKDLHDKGIGSLMVEGGGRTIFHFCSCGLIDFWIVTMSPKIMGSQKSVRYSSFKSPLNNGISNPRYTQLGSDCIVFGKSQTSKGLIKETL